MVDLFVLDWVPQVWRLILRIFLAGVCGFIIGYERKSRSKEAGIRTHALVAMASALMMIISKYAFADLGATKFDGARIAAQVVTGIGFLGAGMIFYRRDILHGLTTAAGIWATAGLGMALGAGLYVVGIATTVMILLFQVLLHLPIKSFKSRHVPILRGTLILESVKDIDKFMSELGIVKFLVFRTSLPNENGKIVTEVEFVTEKPYLAQEIFEIAKNNPLVKSLEKTDEI